MNFFVFLNNAFLNSYEQVNGQSDRCIMESEQKYKMTTRCSGKRWLAMQSITKYEQWTGNKLIYTISNLFFICKKYKGLSILACQAHLADLSRININLVSYMKKSTSPRKYWSECISANQNAPCRTFVLVNQASSAHFPCELDRIKS